MKKAIIILVAMAMALASVPIAFAQVQGPLNVNSNFPVWVQDVTGLQVDIPTPPIGVAAGAGGVAVNPPTMTFAAPIAAPDPQAAFSQQIGFGPECFYWGASASMDIGGTKKGALLTMALEASFLPNVIADGNQFIFSRVRIRIDTPVAGDYRVTHPYGVETFTGVPAGTRAINFTADIGGPPGSATCPNPMFTNPKSILSQGLLIADTINVQLQPTDPPDLSDATKWIGDGVTLTTVHGGPNPAANIFKVEYLGPAAGVNLDGAGNPVVQTNLFVVSGHLFGGVVPAPVPPPPPPTPLSLLRSTYGRTAAGLTVDVFATSDPGATLNADIATLTALPMAGDGAGNFFIHHAFPRTTPKPATATVHAAGPAPETPTTLSANVVDTVTITTCAYSVARKTLRIAARSSDTLAPRPVLTALGFGVIPATGAVRTINLGAAKPPASVTVSSGAGGTATQFVTIGP